MITFRSNFSKRFLLFLCLPFEICSLIDHSDNHPVFHQYELLNYDPARNIHAIRNFQKIKKLKHQYESHYLSIVVKSIRHTFQLLLKEQNVGVWGLDEEILFVDGHVAEYKASEVSGWIRRGVFFGTIKMNSSLTYQIEDIKPHLHEIKNQSFILSRHSLIYKLIDIKTDIYDQYKFHSHYYDIHHKTSQSEETHNFSKRWSVKSIKMRTLRSSGNPSVSQATEPTNPKSICEVELSVHHSFTDNYGSQVGALGTAIHILHEASKIFDDKDIKSYGGGISYRVTKVNVIPRNSDILKNVASQPSKILDVMLKRKEREQYCLTGVLIHQNWGPTLGLATVRHPGQSVCDQQAVFTVSSVLGGMTMPISHLILVTAHEIGHTLGVYHDPHPDCPRGCVEITRRECMATSFLGDGHLMNYALNSGLFSNNYKFSTCSKEVIEKILTKRSRACLKEISEPICGNGVVEANEDCDGGYFHLDPCCTAKCKLKDGKNCSPAQGECCTQRCSFKESGAQCLNDAECHEAGSCDGTSAVCKAGKNKEDDSVCRGGSGLCSDGKCSKSICEKDNSRKILCQCTGQYQCRVCCGFKPTGSISQAKSVSLVCTLYTSNISLPNGYPCNNNKGYCDNSGKCNDYHGDSAVTKIYEFLTSSNIWSRLFEQIDQMTALITFLSIIFVFGVITKMFNKDYESMCQEIRDSILRNE